MLAATPLGGCLGVGGSGSFGAVAQGGVALHVATTRKLADGGKQAPFFDASRNRLSYAVARFGATQPSGIGRIGALVAGGDDVLSVEPRPGDPADALAEALRGRASLMFVHGYNQTFESAAADAVHLTQGIGFRGNAALFSWSSRGGLLDYVYDRESALIARDALADTLTAVLNDPGAGKFHLVAHSMGTLVTLEALRSYRDRNGNRGIENIGALVMASPDIDLDVFRAGVARLGPLRDKMIVITATNDRALSVSRRLAGGARVGALPASELEGLGVRVVDATEFASGLVRHDAFVADADVRGVIKRAVERA